MYIFTVFMFVSFVDLKKKCTCNKETYSAGRRHTVC